MAIDPTGPSENLLDFFFFSVNYPFVNWMLVLIRAFLASSSFKLTLELIDATFQGGK